MVATKYTYSISVDFPNAQVSTDRLTNEIRDSDIVISLDYINTSGDDCDIWFKDSLSSGDETILDGIIDVHNGESIENPLSNDGVPLVELTGTQEEDHVTKVAIYPRRGEEITISTHNFADPCSWFGESVRVTGGILTDSGDGYIFTYGTGESKKEFWIDSVTGRIHDQDVHKAKVAHGYNVKVYIDGYEATQAPIFVFDSNDGAYDYYVTYHKGEVHFFENQSGNTITADFSYANGSIFTISPQSGIHYQIEDAEADFSIDPDNTGKIVMKDTIAYDVRGYAYVFVPLDADTNTLNNVTVFADNDVTLYGSQTVDGVDTTSNMRVACFNQNVPTEDGIYVASDGYWTRASDCPTGKNMYGWVFFIDGGATHATRGYTVANSPGSDVIGTDNIIPYLYFEAGSKVVLLNRRFPRFSTIIQNARGTHPFVAATGASSLQITTMETSLRDAMEIGRGTIFPLQCLPFPYLTVAELQPEYGMDIIVYLENDIATDGEMQGITFYGTQHTAH